MPIQITCPACRKTLKAPDTLAGKNAKCPNCGTLITVPAVPEEILDAELAAPEPQPSTSPISDMLGEEEEYKFQNPYESPAPPPEQRRPCPACGEMILYNAAKCRYCGEIFDPALKKAARKKSGDASEDMSTGDWVVALLCSGIGCIAGIVWMIQGKPKGGKMLGVSICGVIFWNIVRFAIEAANHHR